MRIPEASVNSGQYYTEDNQQWQNGAVMEGGPPHPVPTVDGYVHPPHVYPSQRPPHMAPAPGYMVPGAPYYGGYGVVPAPMVPPPADDFADYMWMENEEEFDKQVMQQLEEEALMEQCIEAMLEDERERLNGHTSNGQPSVSLEEQVSKSTLNPLAAEFVPTRSPVAAPAPANKTQPVEVSANDTVSDVKEKPTVSESSSRSDTTEDVKSDESESVEKPKSPTASKTEEAKKADQKETKKDKSKTEVNTIKSDTKNAKSEAKIAKNEVKTAKPEVKVAKVEPKPAAAKPKSEPKVTAPKTAKKDVKTTKTEPKTAAAATKEQPKAVETEAPAPAAAEPAKTASNSMETVVTAAKPINYAAAARAGKPRKSEAPTAAATK